MLTSASVCLSIIMEYRKLAVVEDQKRVVRAQAMELLLWSVDAVIR